MFLLPITALNVPRGKSGGPPGPAVPQLSTCGVRLGLGVRLGVAACGGAARSTGGGDSIHPSICLPSISLLAATFNTALFTGAPRVETRAVVSFIWMIVCVFALCVTAGERVKHYVHTNAG